MVVTALRAQDVLRPMSSLLVIGETGQLAIALKRACDNGGIKARFLPRTKLDLSATHETILTVLSEFPQPDAIILAAAYTDVEKAESECETVYNVNVRGTDAVAHYCETHNIPLVFISTDYVFDGRQTQPYTIEDKTNPLNFYGETKRLAEEHILSLTTPHAAIRTSWVFDGISKNFLTTMLRLAETRSTLSVVMDQIGRPTYAGHLAAACLKVTGALIENAETVNGLHHITGQGQPTSWTEFAKAIFKASNKDILIKPIPTKDYPTAAHRPLNGVLSNARYNALFNQPLPSWRRGLEDALRERQYAHKVNG